MNVIPVYFHISVGDKKFLKRVPVQSIMPQHSLIKLAGHSFVVEHTEQNLDSYIDAYTDGGMEPLYGPFESAYLIPNPKCHSEEDYPQIIKALAKIGILPREEKPKPKH